jgi:signal transduction histidine kinase
VAVRPPELRAKTWREILVMLALNFLIAVMLLALGVPGGFLRTYTTCNAIGLSIWGLISLLRRFVGQRFPVLPLALIAVPLGFIAGSKIAALTGTADLVTLVARDPTHQWRALLGSLMVATFATGFVILYWRSQSYQADLQSERRRAAEALQSETSARLALLQAQIEPHFLFNTLANVQSVIDTDPTTAKSILENLNQYLRVSLGRTRKPSSTLADEISLVTALLAIAGMRLGDRLAYSISVPEGLGSASLPPLLLQPLVENALKHGIEPAVHGGEIVVEARATGESPTASGSVAPGASLTLRVTDSGVGLNAGSPEGVGLANVRGRLASLYGDRGRLAIFSHEPHGVVAEITIPLTQ